MAVLVLSELLAYIKVDTASHMAVADFHEHDTVTARLHVTFPFVECKGENVLCTCTADCKEPLIIPSEPTIMTLLERLLRGRGTHSCPVRVVVQCARVLLSILFSNARLGATTGAVG